MDVCGEEFYTAYVGSLDRLLDIMARAGASEEVLTEIIFKMDQALGKLGSMCHPSTPDMCHFKGQLYLGCATLLMMRSTKDKRAWKKNKRLVELLILEAFQGEVVPQHYCDGGTRKVIAGHMWEQLCDEESEQFIKIWGIDRNIGERLYSVVFLKEKQLEMMVSSCLAQYTVVSTSGAMPSTAVVDMYNKEYLNKYSSDLHMLTWLLSRYSRDSGTDLVHQLTSAWSPLPSQNISILDMQTFLCDIIIAIRRSEKELVDMPTLPPSLAQVKVNKTQEQWWDVAWKARSGLLAADLEEVTTENINFSVSDYHHSLLSKLLERENMSKVCILQGSCGKSVNLPFFLVRNALPDFPNIVSCLTCCQLDDDAIYLSLPDVSFETLSVVKQLLTTGTSEVVEPDVIKDVLEFVSGMKIDTIPFESADEEEDMFQNLIDNVTFEEPESVDQISLGSFNIGSKCSKSCENGCHRVVQTWQESDINRLREIFESDQVILTKTKLLNHLIAQDDIGCLAISYVVKGHEFCLDYFAFITGCTSYLVKKVLLDFHSGQRLYLHGNSGCMKNKSAGTISAVCWLKAFSEAYGQFSPDQNVTVLSYWLNKQALFKLYQDETSGPHISQSLFYLMFKTTFGHNRVDKSLPWIREDIKVL